jgi:hypothetical protein
MHPSSSLEIKILLNLKNEIDLLRSKSTDSLIQKWFKLKGIETPIESFDTFKYDVHFIGEKANPKYNGFGIVIYPSETSFNKCYIGQFKRGRRNGKGLRLMNNTIFQGTYKRDLKHGPAKVWKIEKSKLTRVFEGNYLDGKMHGKCYLKDEKHTFEGQIFKGLYHGKCKIIYPDGNVFEGSMIKGEMCGKAKITYKNGDRYEGGLLNNKRTGEGNYYWAKGNESMNFSSNLSTTKTSGSINKNKNSYIYKDWQFANKRENSELN